VVLGLNWEAISLPGDRGLNSYEISIIGSAEKVKKQGEGINL
jgi:hypothetical protein